jgi:hypothetical protein
MGYMGGMNCDEGMQLQAAGKPWAALHVILEDLGAKAHREAICGRVLDYFEQYFRIGPEPRAVCVLDNMDHDFLKQEFGGVANRGIHWPIRGQGLGIWPYYVRDVIAWYDEQAGEVVWPYASVIYLHGSTCDSDVGLTLTFAHELQHFLQYAHERLLWTMNKLLVDIHNEEFSVWWDFPVEIEARIIAKRVAESLFGAEPVRKHIQERIKAHLTDNDVKDWEFVQGINPSVPYSLTEGTKTLVLKHRRQLEEYVRRCKDDAEALRRSGLRFEELIDVDFGALT